MPHSRDSAGATKAMTRISYPSIIVMAMAITTVTICSRCIGWVWIA